MAARAAAGNVRLSGAYACLVLALLSTQASGLFAQSKNTSNTLQLDHGAPRPEAVIESLEWLAGYWQGASPLGAAEEIWTSPSHGTMVGAFKVVRENETGPYFYEFVEIAEEEGSLTLKVKHFNPDLNGWEEKDGYVAFPLVKLSENEAHFSGLTYRRIGDELRSWVAIAQKDGEPKEVEFVFRRVASEVREPILGRSRSPASR